MSSERVISVARDFSRTPGPRYTSQGDWSGEEFRKRQAAGTPIPAPITMAS